MEMDITESSSFMEASMDDSYLSGLRSIRGRRSYKPLQEMPRNTSASRSVRSVTSSIDAAEEPDGVIRRASAAISNANMELDDSIVDYKRVLDNLESEVAAVSKTVELLRTVMGTPTAPPRASKRARQDTDGSRPPALSSRSEGEGVSSTEVRSTPAARGRRRRRRATTEISSPLLRVPLERGWKRELVYRAALDQHSRRKADIYYYSPQGKKLRSTREVAEHLSGTGLTIENFSFYKEPLGVDDPLKEKIREARRRRGGPRLIEGADHFTTIYLRKRCLLIKP